MESNNVWSSVAGSFCSVPCLKAHAYYNIHHELSRITVEQCPAAQTEHALLNHLPARAYYVTTYLQLTGKADRPDPGNEMRKPGIFLQFSEVIMCENMRW